MTTNGDTTITDPVMILFFEAPAPEPLNDVTFRVVVARPIFETPSRPISPLTEYGGVFYILCGGCIYFVYASTSSTYFIFPLPPFLPVTLTRITLPLIPSPLAPLPQNSFPGVIPTTRSHSTGEKSYCDGIKWFEYHYGVKENINGTHQLCQ